MPNQRPPTPFELYEQNVEMLTNIRRDCQRAGMGSDAMTDEEIKETAMKFMKCDVDELEGRKHAVNVYLKEHSPEHVKSQMITISVDQKLTPTEAIEVQFTIIEKIKLANYKCLANVSHTFEYYTKEGFNPHIHIVTDKIKSDGQVAQLIRRKLKDMPAAYRIFVNTLNYQAHTDYMHGDKTDEKMDYVEKDEIFREIHHIENIYKWT